MSLITLKNVGVALADPLFTGLDLSLPKGCRMGLVAANGGGKTTLLHCIAGLTDPTTGDITTARGLRVGFMQQIVPQALRDLTLYDAVLAAMPPEQADYESWRVDIVLDDLAIPHDLRTRPLGKLSGGWQRMALLAREMVRDPDAMLMDEPTNHLDLMRIGQLQTYMANLPRDMPMLIASHDRAFLDAVTTHTLFLRSANSRVFALPYSAARDALDEADAADARRFDNDMKQASQLRRQAAKLKNIGVNSGSDLLITKTKQLKDRADKLEDAARPAHKDRTAGLIKLSNADTHAKALVAFDDVAVTTPDGRVLFKTGKIWINRGDRIVLLGPNGTGKTRLVDMVQRAIDGEVAGIRAAPTLVMGYSDQGVTQLDPNDTPMQAITARFDVGDQRARGLLAGAGFTIDHQNAKTAILSGGQKSRLAMVVLRLTNPNFYLLDEPTNHIDIDGQEALQSELEKHEVSCLLVSHDRTFVRETGTRFWEIRGKRLIEVDSPEPFFAAALGEGG